MKEFITNNFTLVERRIEVENDYYSRYMSACFIDNKRFETIIKNFGGYTYNVCVGKIGNVVIFNGLTWISVHDTNSYDENDEWAKKFDKMFLKKE